MKKTYAGGAMLCIVVLFFLTGCTTNMTQRLSDKLDTAALYKSYGVYPSDLSPRSKCNAPPTVRIINIETRIEDFKMLENGPFTGLVNPKETMTAVGLYLKSGFERSHIRVDERSTKVLQIKMNDLKSIAGVWSFGSYFSMEVNIPDINFTNSFEAKDNAMLGDTAAAYAIHVVSRQVIEDPVIQDYILCR